MKDISKIHWPDLFKAVSHECHGNSKVLFSLKEICETRHGSAMCYLGLDPFAITHITGITDSGT